MRILLGLFLTLSIVGCNPQEEVNNANQENSSAFEREYAKVKETAAKRPPVASRQMTGNEPRRFTRPEIGMPIEDFELLCINPKERTSEDDVNVFRSANGTTITHRRGYSEKRAKNDCWGTFTFRDGVLDSIFN